MSDESRMNVLKFIKCVKQRECLYNRQCADYRQRFVVMDSWRNVAREMNLNVMDCKEKWHNLRSNYMRERKKFIGPGIKKWHLLDELSFLEPHHCAKRTGKKRKYVVPNFKNPENNFDILTPHSMVASSKQFTITNVAETFNEEDKHNCYNNDSNDLQQNITDDLNLTHPNTKTANPSPIEILDHSDVDPMEQNGESLNVISDRDEPDCLYEGMDQMQKDPNRKRRKKKVRNLDYEYFKQIRKLSEHLTQPDEDSDRMFLLSLLPFVKQLSAKDNIDFRVEVQTILQRKLNN